MRGKIWRRLLPNFSANKKSDRPLTKAIAHFQQKLSLII
jgi:hypothetical protein